MELYKYLKPITIPLKDLLLDPNNPRFSELGEELYVIPEQRFVDDKVQQNTFDKMRDPLFDVSELKDTIKTIGFLPMDRVVVRKWKGKPKEQSQEKFVVIEGNRRITALKWLINLHEIGKETFSATQLTNFTEIECLLLDDANAPNVTNLILPGLRHVSGIKEWGPYQKAKAVYSLRKGGLSPQEAAQSIGLSTRAANQSYRCYIALEEMKSNDEFGDFTDPKMYSYFEEAFKKTVIKKWLGWDDSLESFTNKDNLAEFYSWMVPQEDGSSPKLPEAKSIRDLAVFIEDETALNIFRSTDGTLQRALAKFEIDHPEDWFPKITSAISALKMLTPDILRQMNKDTIAVLEGLSQMITQTLADREKLLK